MKDKPFIERLKIFKDDRKRAFDYFAEHYGIVETVIFTKSKLGWFDYFLLRLMAKRKITVALIYKDIFK